MFRIKELRESKGISMKEAARHLGMPYTTYVNYEKGLREPTSEILIQIADFFNVSIDFLVGRNADGNFNPSIERGNEEVISLTTEKRNILKIAARDGSYQERILSDQQLAALKAILDQMPDVPEDL